MKNKILLFLLIVSLLFAGAAFWYRMPVSFLLMQGSKVTSIEVYDSISDCTFTIVSADKVREISQGFASAHLSRTGLTRDAVGYRFHLTFLDSNGKTLEDLLLNSSSVVRKDPFFYRDSSGSLPFKIIEQIEYAAPCS